MGAGDDLLDLTGYGDNLSVHAYGGAGNDVIVGGVYKDHIIGGTGNDTMAGGGENDVFVFSKFASRANDVIIDFNEGDDISIMQVSDSAYETVGAAANLNPGTLQDLGHVGGAYLKSAIDVNGSAVLTLKTNDTITIVGVTVHQLEAWDVI